MYNNISRSQIFVLDQDEALDFYVHMRGLERPSARPLASTRTAE